MDRGRNKLQRFYCQEKGIYFRAGFISFLSLLSWNERMSPWLVGEIPGPLAFKGTIKKENLMCDASRIWRKSPDGNPTIRNTITVTFKAFTCTLNGLFPVISKCENPELQEESWKPCTHRKAARVQFKVKKTSALFLSSPEAAAAEAKRGQVSQVGSIHFYLLLKSCKSPSSSLPFLLQFFMLCVYPLGYSKRERAI